MRKEGDEEEEEERGRVEVDGDIESGQAPSPREFLIFFSRRLASIVLKIVLSKNILPKLF